MFKKPIRVGKNLKKNRKMEIRRERKEDYKKTENLVREAFWNVYRPGCFEHLVINKMRNDDCFIPEFDYVIEEDGEIVA